MVTKSKFNLYKLEWKAFWREYKGIGKINLFIYSIFCLVLYFMVYIATVFSINTYIILNCYLLLFTLSFIGRKTDIKTQTLYSEKTRNLYTTPLAPQQIVSLKSFKFTSAFLTDCFIMFTPFVICLLLLGLKFKDVTSYTLLGILLGSILLFVKELSFTKLPMKNTTGLIKVIVLGLSAGLSIGILESVITNKNNQIVEFYKSLLSTDLTVGIPYLLLICIPVVLFWNRIFILDDMKNKLVLRAKQSEEKNSSIIKGEFAKQLKTSNREGNFTNKFLNTLLLYGCFLITYYSSSLFLNSHFLFRKDTFFILSIVIASRNSKVFFNSRSIYSEATMIYSFLFSKYKISNILFYRVLINSLSTLVLNLSFIIPLYVMSNLEIELLVLALLVSSILSIALSCIQEYYLANKVLYLVSIGNENKGSMIKRILWESLLTMVVMYSYIFTIVIDANLIIAYSTIASLILLGLIIIFTIKILKGNKKFYGELKEYY